MQTRISGTFDDWALSPMPLEDNGEKCGPRTAFANYDFNGFPNVVCRVSHQKEGHGCVAYTKKPLTVGSVWRVTLLKSKYGSEPSHLTFGLTTTIPTEPPPALSLKVDKNNFFFEVIYEHKPSVHEQFRPRLRSRGYGMSKSAALLLTENGDLHLYCDEMYVERLQTGLPVGEPLYGGVDVLGCLMQIKSEILSRPNPSIPPVSAFFQSKPVKVEVLVSEKSITVVPKGLGVAVKLQPKSMNFDSSSPIVIFFRVCSLESFVFPDGAQAGSLTYLISSDNTLDEEVEIIVQHFLDIPTNEQAKYLSFFVGKPPTDGSNKVHLVPKPGKFKANDELGSFKTKELGYVNVGTTQPAKIKKRYRALCCYTKKESPTKHVAVGVTLDNEFYKSNFREAMETEFQSKMAYRSKANVSFDQGTCCVVELQGSTHRHGWKSIRETGSEIAEDEVDYDETEDLSMLDYPPRVLYCVLGYEHAERSALKLEMVGLDRPVSFTIPLIPPSSDSARTSSIWSDKTQEYEVNMLTLLSLEGINIIEETTPHYREICAILLNDKRGNRVQNIELDERNGEEKIKAVYRRWMRESEHPSWDTLLDCFRQCRLNSLTHRIEEKLGRLPPTPPPGSQSLDGAGIGSCQVDSGRQDQPLITEDPSSKYSCCHNCSVL